MVTYQPYKQDYKIFCEDGIYYACFMDGENKPQKVEIAEDVYQAFVDARKNEKRVQNHKERHEEYVDLTAEEISKKAVFGNWNAHEQSVEDVICERESLETLNIAIASLSEVQQRRVILHFINGLTFAETAKLENCKKQNVHLSVMAALKKIKLFF